MSVGKSVRLFLADGTPGGLLTAEIMNWTGHVAAAPRSDLGALLKRPEASRTGIYILLGDDPESMGGSLAYIGEGDDVAKRLYHHSRNEDQGGKDFWDRAIVLTSKDTNLTKAHARYLESRFISLAQEANRSRLTNGTAPPLLPLPESDISDMEYFVTQAKIILPVLGVNIFRTTTTLRQPSDPTDVAAPADPSVSPIFEIFVKKYGIRASAQEIDGEFTVKKGSMARLSFTENSSNYELLHDELLKSGQLVQDGEDTAIFAQDIVFRSPSAAAAIVAGRAANGRVEWRIPGTGISFGSWQNQDVESNFGGNES
ncbi:GIY-YIG nuclease family protein [Pseudarthrobacter sp. L1SW]|uniref:GIY-YIG nuclease family protein n=1 Tax=Pseudarthrobacter sp. L1SW TaxID=2851598 RepID=UPI001E36DB8A|nr:GIY-YIG nuclease family protein [Pseudarthrobacter sp. L1SW]UEL27980.1 GIY-YIG nuclease family protein [Pseudarthrobacter sp. L1SW]